MTSSLNIALAQTNPTVGDIQGNMTQVETLTRHAAGKADLLVFPELVTCGYPPEDLVTKPSFITAIRKAVDHFVQRTADLDIHVILPTAWEIDGDLFNAALLIHRGKIISTHIKWNLPNYGVFDEVRLFKNNREDTPFTINGICCGILVCEDMWFPDKAAALKEQGAEIFLVPNASPYEFDKHGQRLGHAQKRISETGCPVLYVNQWGGQDELVFDGLSFIADRDGNLTHKAAPFSDALMITEWQKDDHGNLTCLTPDSVYQKDDTETLYTALVTGLRDYVNKNGFPGVLIGMSGGIDSALSAIIAVDALGAENVQCVMMPSRYTSTESLDDAKAMIDAIGARYDIISITDTVDSIESAIKDTLPPQPSPTTFENIQSRARGLLLMALSNANGKMVLSTGNKSEMAVGYATLYGDMCGGFNALKDLYKTQVYTLSAWRNNHLPAGCFGPQGVVVPENIITKAPTAELKDNQTDQDSLPPYDELDAILHGMIEKDQGPVELIDEGFTAESVNQVWRLLHLAEYKRRQAPLGVKITPRSFGRDRRYPITNGYTKSHK